MKEIGVCVFPMVLKLSAKREITALAFIPPHLQHFGRVMTFDWLSVFMKKLS
jgi:hypothetical protein